MVCIREAASAGLNAGQPQTLLLVRKQMAWWEGWLCSRASVWVWRHPVWESHVRRWVLRWKASTWNVVPIRWPRVADWTPLSRVAQLLDLSRVLWALTLASVGAPRSCSEQNRWRGSSPESTRLLWDSFVLQNKRVCWCKRKCQS